MNYYNNRDLGYGNYQNYMPYQSQYQPGLAGKLVDSLEVVRAAEVPLGSFGVFPKGDFSEVYVKSWNPNGTTNITTYKAEIPAEAPIDINTEIINRITMLETKIDAVLGQKIPQTGTPQKKETKVNEF